MYTLWALLFAAVQNGKYVVLVANKRYILGIAGVIEQPPQVFCCNNHGFRLLCLSLAGLDKHGGVDVTSDTKICCQQDLVSGSVIRNIKPIALANNGHWSGLCQ